MKHCRNKSRVHEELLAAFCYRVCSYVNNRTYQDKVLLQREIQVSGTRTNGEQS